MIIKDKGKNLRSDIQPEIDEEGNIKVLFKFNIKKDFNSI